MRRISRLLAALILLAAMAVPAERGMAACASPDSAGNTVNGCGVQDPLAGVPFCDDGTRAAFVVNGRPACDMDPQPYRVRVPGGERTMIGLRSLADMLTYQGMPTVVDWFTERGPYGSTTTYVSAANRHREILLQIGSPVVRRWMIGDGGVKQEISPVTLDVAPELRNGRTMVPLRGAFEALGAVITSYDPVVSVSYTDDPQTDDTNQAEAIAPGALSAYGARLITLDDLYFLGDIQRYHAAQLAAGNTHWAATVPLQYIRFAVLHDTIQQRRQLTDSEYTWIGTSSAPILGHVLSGADVRRIAQNGEMGIDIIADHWGWQESGYDPYTGRWVDFSRYNQLKRQNPNLNGPDRMHVIRDAHQVIIMYIASEAKATGRPWVVPSRFNENIPFYRQVENLSEYANPDISTPFRVMKDNLVDYQRMMQMEQMTPAEFDHLLQEYRFTTSPRGGSSEAARNEMDIEGVNYTTFNDAGEVTGYSGPVPSPSDEE